MNDVQLTAYYQFRKFFLDLEDTNSKKIYVICIILNVIIPKQNKNCIK
jgi:hypothetical protein